MFKNIIPLEILMQLPQQQVHILRDIRLKQIEESNKQMQAQMPGPAAASSGGPAASSGISNTAFDDLVNEIT
jgi:hypothetical protein